MDWNGHYTFVRRFHQGGGRLMAVALESYHATTYGMTFGFDGGRWTMMGEPGAVLGYEADLYVAPDGTAYATGSFAAYVSPPGGAWRVDSLLTGWRRVAGAGGVVFGYRADGYPTRHTVERLTGRTLTDIGLPAAYAGRQVTGFAAAGGSELYLSTETETLHWNGSGWSVVAPGAGLGLHALVAPAGGGTVHGVLGRSALYALRQGRAERIANPLEDRGETIISLAVDRDGSPFLLHRRGVFFRTAAGWREHRLPEEYVNATAVLLAEDGSAWVSVYRPTGEMTRYGERHELVMLRIRARIR